MNDSSGCNMKPVLYYDDRSPPVRSVLMLIEMLKIDIELKFVDLFKGEQLIDEFKKLSPAHTVPVLVDDDVVLTDSHVILIHLCEKYQGEHLQLWPKDYKERMQVLNLLLFESSVVFRRDSEMMSEIVRKTFAHIDIAFHQRKILEVFDMLESYLSKHKFMALDKLTIADLSIVTTVSTVDLMFPIQGGRMSQQWPLLEKWFHNMKTMPEYQITLKGLNSLRMSVEERGAFKFPNCGEEGVDEGK